MLFLFQHLWIPAGKLLNRVIKINLLLDVLQAHLEALHDAIDKYKPFLQKIDAIKKVILSLSLSPTTNDVPHQLKAFSFQKVIGSVRQALAELTALGETEKQMRQDIMAATEKYQPIPKNIG